MSMEKLIKRTIYVATCPGYGKKCDTKVVKESDPPKEILCIACGRWVQFEEVSYIGKEIGDTSKEISE